MAYSRSCLDRSMHHCCHVANPPITAAMLLVTRYPTQLTLPDDRVLIVGGYYSLFGPPNPAVEIFDPKTEALVTHNSIPFTTITDW